MNNSSEEAISNDTAAKTGRPFRVLFLGNSITIHGPKPEIGWTGDCGMAASAQEKDFVHLLLQRLAALAGGTTPEARIANIADFERGFASYDGGEWFEALANFQADMLVLAIGENVAALTAEQDQAQFGAAVSALLARMSLKKKPAIYVRSTFWPDPVKDAALQQACADSGATYVDISHLAADEQNYARSEREFIHAGVAAHPGDAGMAAIAAAIWEAIQKDNLDT
jgi:hypothetical protein